MSRGIEKICLILNSFVFSGMKILRKIVENPFVNLSAGTILILSSGTEILSELNELSFNEIRSHHGVFVFGLLHVLRVLPDIFEGLEYVSESEK